MLNQLQKIIAIFIIILINAQSGFGQNCFNSDFETGDVSGYSTFVGSIDGSGNIVVDTETLDPERHKLVSILDGYDEIAMEFCEINKYLPVVPPSGGIYAMRLGNSDSGSEAERILLRFTVTNENSFFLLRYAVLLNDPSHDDYQQPRFKLSIKDQDGDEYPCGKYEVVAAPNIENFENCNDDWKVRPWTNIGIELISYLGEEIIIEMMTVDCSLGAHAGFAYLDATCRPLEIELFNNCTDTSTAIMKVTPGFDAYEWSTGDTSSEITIPNPVIGDIYYVTVTSATGCQLELSDTIPNYEIAIPPFFGPSTAVPYCKDTTFWFSPPGTNLQQIYSIDQQSFVDSILVNTAFSSEYTFIALSDAGCAFDTVTHFFGGTPAVLSDIQHPCNGLSNGSISLIPLGGNNSFGYEWSTGDMGPLADNLEGGQFSVTITDQAGCTLIEDFVIDASQSLNITSEISEYLCDDIYGSATINVDGSTGPYRYSFDNGLNFYTNNYYNLFSEGENLVIIQDSKECQDSLYIFFNASATPEINSMDVLIDSCGTNQSSINVNNVTNATAPLLYSINNTNFGQSNNFNNLIPGVYNIEVQDAYGCIGSSTVNIPLVEQILITDILMSQPTCGFANGSLTINTSDMAEISYALDNGPFQKSNYFENLNDGTYLVKIKYGNDCEDSMIHNLIGLSIPEISPIDIEYVPCTNGKNKFSIEVENGQQPYQYQLDNNLFQSSNDFINIPPGEHSIQIIDYNDCAETIVFQIEPFDSLIYRVANINEPDCGIPNGDIELNFTGGKGTITIEYDNEFYQEQTFFDGLADGLHSFILSDEADCSYTIDQELLADCQVYVPNSFTPNGDGVNDVLTINIAQYASATIRRFNVFDRWGEPIFSSNNQFITGTTPLSWNGIFKGQPCPTGVYTYELELVMYNKEVLKLQGSITLIL